MHGKLKYILNFLLRLIVVNSAHVEAAWVFSLLLELEVNLLVRK